MEDHDMKERDELRRLRKELAEQYNTASQEQLEGWSRLKGSRVVIDRLIDLAFVCADIERRAVIGTKHSAQLADAEASVSRIQMAMGDSERRMQRLQRKGGPQHLLERAVATHNQNVDGLAAAQKGLDELKRGGMQNRIPTEAEKTACEAMCIGTIDELADRGFSSVAEAREAQALKTEKSLSLRAQAATTLKERMDNLSKTLRLQFEAAKAKADEIRREHARVEERMHTMPTDGIDAGALFDKFQEYRDQMGAIFKESGSDDADVRQLVESASQLHISMDSVLELAKFTKEDDKEARMTDMVDKLASVAAHIGRTADLGDEPTSSPGENASRIADIADSAAKMRHAEMMKMMSSAKVAGQEREMRMLTKLDEMQQEQRKAAEEAQEALVKIQHMPPVIQEIPTEQRAQVVADMCQKHDCPAHVTLEMLQKGCSAAAPTPEVKRWAGSRGLDTTGLAAQMESMRAMVQASFTQMCAKELTVGFDLEEVNRNNGELASALVSGEKKGKSYKTYPGQRQTQTASFHLRENGRYHIIVSLMEEDTAAPSTLDAIQEIRINGRPLKLVGAPVHDKRSIKAVGIWDLRSFYADPMLEEAQHVFGKAAEGSVFSMARCAMCHRKIRRSEKRMKCKGCGYTVHVKCRGEVNTACTALIPPEEETNTLAAIDKLVKKEKEAEADAQARQRSMAGGAGAAECAYDTPVAAVGTTSVAEEEKVVLDAKRTEAMVNLNRLTPNPKKNRDYFDVEIVYKLVGVDDPIDWSRQVQCVVHSYNDSMRSLEMKRNLKELNDSIPPWAKTLGQVVLTSVVRSITGGIVTV